MFISSVFTAIAASGLSGSVMPRDATSAEKIDSLPSPGLQYFERILFAFPPSAVIINISSAASYYFSLS